MRERFTRRQLISMAAASGAIIAGEIWWPGKRLISIPKPATDNLTIEAWMHFRGEQAMVSEFRLTTGVARYEVGDFIEVEADGWQRVHRVVIFDKLAGSDTIKLVGV